MRPINNKSSPAVPKLRFPEFLDSSEWEERALDEICEVNPSNAEIPEQFIYIDLESVTAGNLTTKKKINKKDAPSRAQRLLKNGDVIYQIVRPYQKNNFFCKFDDDQDYVASTGYAQLRAFVSENYLYYVLDTDAFVGRVVAKCTGSNYPAINSSDLAKIPVFAPNLQEQQKIADCLSSFDALITTQTQKLQALQQHKKGLMQNLFPAEGKTIPKLRFPEFVKEGEWVERKLGEIGEPLMCKRAFKEQTTTNPDNSIPFYKIGTFGREPDSYISIDLYNEFRSKYSFPNKGDILISASGTIGRLVVYDGSPAYFQDSNIVWLDNNEELILNSLLFYCYSILNWQTSDGGVIKRLYNSDLRNIQIRFPIEKTEQQKIADFLSSLDALITTQTQKIEALQQHKKGLMQQLFPATDAAIA